MNPTQQSPTEPTVSLFSRARAALLAVLGLEPLAFMITCVVYANMHRPATENQIQAQMGIFIGCFFPLAIMTCVLMVTVFFPAKRLPPHDDLRFEQGRVATVLLLAAIGHGLAFLMCGLAMVNSREPLYELGVRALIWTGMLVPGGAIALYFLLRPRKIPGFDYTKSKEANHWKLGGMIYCNPADPRYLVERRYGDGVTINFGYRGPMSGRWPYLLAMAMPLIFLTIVLALLWLFGRG